MEKVLSPPVHTWYICQAKNPRNWMVATSTKARSLCCNPVVTLLVNPTCHIQFEPICHIWVEKKNCRQIYNGTDRHTCTLYTHTKHCTIHTHIYNTRIQDNKLCHSRRYCTERIISNLALSSAIWVEHIQLELRAVRHKSLDSSFAANVTNLLGPSSPTEIVHILRLMKDRVFTRMSEYQWWYWCLKW